MSGAEIEPAAAQTHAQTHAQTLALAERIEPWTDSPLFEELLATATTTLTARQEAQARQYREDGFLVLEDVFDPATIDAAARDCRAAFEAGAKPRSALVSQDELRIQDGCLEYPSILSLAIEPAILDVLAMLYRRRPIPFQTLNFITGSQQSPHSDAIHFSCRPARFMCGVWIALEDIDDDNGPLLYYPGSHRMPSIDMFDLGLPADGEFDPNYQHYESFVLAAMQEAGIEPLRLRVPRGSALIWAANLVHGGDAVRDRNRTRLSQVTHYYFEDCFYYTPMYSNRALGEYQMRAVVDLRSGEAVAQRVRGEVVKTVGVDGELERLVRPVESLEGAQAGGGTARTGAKGLRARLRRMLGGG